MSLAFIQSAVLKHCVCALPTESACTETWWRRVPALWEAPKPLPLTVAQTSLRCSRTRHCVLGLPGSLNFDTPFLFSSQMILFSACCICGLIGGILNVQFLRAVTKKTSSLYPLHLASMSLACIGIGGCTLSSWLTCRLASYEQRRMFSEREHSLHHSHEMAEKVSFVPLQPTASMWRRLQSNLGQSTGSFRREFEELDFLQLWPYWAKNRNFVLFFFLCYFGHTYFQQFHSSLSIPKHSS